MHHPPEGFPDHHLSSSSVENLNEDPALQQFVVILSLQQKKILATIADVMSIIQEK